MVLEKKIFFFLIFLSCQFCLSPKIKNFGNLGNCAFTSNFDSCCNSRFRNNKNELRQNVKGQDMLLEEKMKIPEDLKFSILPCIQNQKLRNLGKCSFI